ncbi:magnesium transporter [Shimia abyssi]|uniref:Magnesium transporter n=1 Tax=Shimia abyssi TaxID=1662395 RepID=A0A2P8FKD7_9RHOB|nr:magnesium transporter [Shimia abyssi]PSL22159.1 magnesium transporter [Shimia abyssi]
MDQTAGQDKALMREIGRMIDIDAKDDVIALMSDWATQDILECLIGLRLPRARKLFQWLPDPLGLKVLVELDDDLHAALFSPSSITTFRGLIAQMPLDEAVDTLVGLPRRFADELIGARDDADDIRAVLAQREDSVANVMRLGVLAVPVDWTVGQLIADIRARSTEIDKIDMMFVVDNARRPLGRLRFREILVAEAETPLIKLVHDDVVLVNAETDREDVLKMAEREELNMLGVTDRAGRLVGGIAPRELADIRRDEAEEDILKLGGVSPASTQFDSPLTILRRRLPWLLGGLGGAGFAAVVIGAYEDALAQAAVLASFIPVVMATAGNAGIQASTVSVQAITSGVEWRGDFGARMVRELSGAALNGLSIGAVTGTLVLIAGQFLSIANPVWLALTILVALMLVTMIAGTVGAAIPFVLRAIKLDPAVATGIFITTTNDVFGVLIFFVIARALYL